MVCDVYVGSLYLVVVVVLGSGELVNLLIVVWPLEQGRWPSVSGTFGLAGQEVGFFTCSKYGTCDTVFSYRLWILHWVSTFCII